jgi:glycosyltransferase involved in cell wall biosynthesis
VTPNVSVIIPVYNEIRFIQKTLESVIGDADEIILSDNASTDGTSDICQSFANKYPEIKYIRQNENIGLFKNFIYCIEQSKGKYIRNLGAHDTPSQGSTSKMLSIIEKNHDISMVYPKYCIYLNPDDSFDSFAVNNFNEYLNSDSSFVRIKHLIKDISDFGMFYSLYKTEILKAGIKTCGVFQNILSDFSIIAYMAKTGKIISENKSVIYRYIPRPETGYEHLKHISKQLIGDESNIYLWNLVCTAELYNLTLSIQQQDNTNDNYTNEILEVIFLNKYNPNELLEALNGKLPVLLKDKEFILNDLNKIVNNFILSNEDKRVNKNKSYSFETIKKLIKYFLPYGLVRLIQKSKSDN